MILRATDPEAKKHKDKSFHLDAYCFDSKPEHILFWELLRESKVKNVWFTGMLTHGQSDFFIQYIDPETHSVRSYYPDFVFVDEKGVYKIVEVKGDNMIDDPTVQAKKRVRAADGGRERHDLSDHQGVRGCAARLSEAPRIVAREGGLCFLIRVTALDSRVN